MYTVIEKKLQKCENLSLFYNSRSTALYITLFNVLYTVNGSYTTWDYVGKLSLYDTFTCITEKRTNTSCPFHKINYVINNQLSYTSE